MDALVASKCSAFNSRPVCSSGALSTSSPFDFSIARRSHLQQLAVELLQLILQLRLGLSSTDLFGQDRKAFGQLLKLSRLP